MTDPLSNHEPHEMIEIQNVVASTTIGAELALQSVAMDLPEAEYDPDTFHGIIYRLPDAPATALLFRTGEIICTGAPSVAAVHEALAGVFDQLRELGLPITDDPEIVIQNVVASGDLGVPLNLTAIAVELGLDNVEYEPEQFPGLIYRLDEPAVVMLVFGTGKVVVTGGKRPADAVTAIETITSRLADRGLLD